MSKKMDYSDEPLYLGERVEDFLPSPDQLVKREETVKVTLELTSKSVEFFKLQAALTHVPYQRMLRGLIDNYAQHHNQKNTTIP